jgi:hypothetical protein
VLGGSIGIIVLIVGLERGHPTVITIPKYRKAIK